MRPVTRHRRGREPPVHPAPAHGGPPRRGARISIRPTAGGSITGPSRPHRPERRIRALRLHRAVTFPRAASTPWSAKTAARCPGRLRPRGLDPDGPAGGRGAGVASPPGRPRPAELAQHHIAGRRLAARAASTRLRRDRLPATVSPPRPRDLGSIRTDAPEAASVAPRAASTSQPRASSGLRGCARPARPPGRAVARQRYRSVSPPVRPRLSVRAWGRPPAPARRARGVSTSAGYRSGRTAGLSPRPWGFDGRRARRVACPGPPSAPVGFSTLARDDRPSPSAASCVPGRAAGRVPAVRPSPRGPVCRRPRAARPRRPGERPRGETESRIATGGGACGSTTTAPAPSRRTRAAEDRAARRHRHRAGTRLGPPGRLRVRKAPCRPVPGPAPLGPPPRPPARGWPRRLRRPIRGRGRRSPADAVRAGGAAPARRSPAPPATGGRAPPRGRAGWW